MNRTVGEMIAAYRKKAGLSQAELADRLAAENIHISGKTISGWEKNRFEPSVTVFLHLCRILNIPDCVEEFFGNNPGDPMAILNDLGKQKVLSYINFLVHPVSYRKEPDVLPTEKAAEIPARRMKKIRLYDARVSAGTGNFLDSDYYGIIEVDEEKAKDADFAVTISGDSMEPEFHDHDTVLVHRQDTLENGEIGIFALNDNAYIKKFQNTKKRTALISLNRKYDPIPIDFETDSFRIFGKVCTPS